MKRRNLINKILVGAWAMLAMTWAFAATPLWTYSAPRPATTTVSAGSAATIQYTVTNQSTRTKDLILRATPGLTASPCHLATKSSTCTLTLTVNGSGVPLEGIHTGPVLCEKGNPLQCYQPSLPNSLNITKSKISNHTVGGSVTGLTGTVTLLNNGTNSTPISTDGNFTFSTAIAEGSTYAVTVGTQPVDQICTVANGSGTMGGANVTNVTVTCSTNNTTLSVSATGTIPVNNGTSSFTVTNTGTTYTAYNVHAVLPAGWTRVTQVSSNCATIAPNNGTCILTFSSTAPYVAQGNITITGDNISSPPTTALAFTATTYNYLIWKVSGATVQVIDTANLSSSEQWGNLVTTNAQSLTDGSSNTSTIHDTGGIGTSAAVSCYNSINGGASIGTWYLPAICEMGGASQGAGCSSGLANIDTNLVQLGFGGLSSFYWSSTEVSSGSQSAAWLQDFASGGGSGQYPNFKLNGHGVRCSRALTP